MKKLDEIESVEAERRCGSGGVQKIIRTQHEEQESQKFKWTVWIYGELNGKKFFIEIIQKLYEYYVDAFINIKEPAKIWIFLLNL